MQHDDKEAARVYKESLKEEKTDALAREFAVRALIRTYEGRRYLWWLLKISQYGVNPFSKDGIQMGFNCGEQNIGQQILAHILEVEPTGFIQMQQENADAERKRNASAGDSAGDEDPSAAS